MTPPGPLRPERPRFTVAQIGAREHYAIPRALHTAGLLAHLYTDAWAPSLLPARGPSAVRALASRRHPDLPREAVTAFTPSTLWRSLTTHPGSSVEDDFLRHAAIGRDFCARVNRTLHRHLRPGGIFFGYDTGCLETLPHVRELGGFSIVDQIDPARVEQDIVLEEDGRFPGLRATPGKIPDTYFDRLSREWAAADAVVVNSKWSSDALVRQGVPREKLHVVPLAYEPPKALPPRQPRQPGAPLRVLFLGQIILRKGVQYLIEAARLLQHENIAFTLAGPLGISKIIFGIMPPNMRYIGRVTRERLTEAYLAHDVFVLPTLSDGFAITQLEAMAHGLPVIATPCCGEVVTDGVDGTVVPPRDPHALAEVLAAWSRTPDLIGSMSEHARQSVRRFSLAHTAASLAAITHTPKSRP